MPNARGPPIEELHFAATPDVDSPPGPKTRRLLRRQRAEESCAVRYPHDLPVAFEAAKGATLRDPDGNVYLDMFSGIGVTNVGHANPYVTEAVVEQSRRLAHTLDFPTEARLDLVERLDEIAPGGLAGNSRVLFGGPTGSDAVEATIKLAKAETGGTGLIAFRGAYHGGTAGALSLTAATDEKTGYTPMLPEVRHVRYPYPHRQGVAPDRAVETALEEVTELLTDPYGGLADPAGIWVEPIQGEGGVVIPPEGFLAGLRDLADDHGIPLIVDEVQTGFGRTGEWFACEHDGVTPDVMPLAKGLGNGHPLAATVYRESLDAAFEPGAHTGTFRGYAPAMRACLRAVDYVESHDLLAHARELGVSMYDRLQEIAADSPLIGDVRGRGLYLAVEFAGDSATAARDAVRERCFEDGVLVWGGGRDHDVVRLIPPLVLTGEQAEAALDVFAEAVRAETRVRR